MRVSLTEDDEDIRGFIAIILRKAGYVVDAYSDGRAALDATASQPADLYILDVRMPGVSGLEVCRVLRASEADPPILMMSAESSDAHVARALDAGATDYLPKPFSRVELLERVNALLGNAAGGVRS